LRHQEDEPQQGEERDRDRAAGGGEPRVTEQVHIDHRVGGGPLGGYQHGQDGGARSERADGRG
jgi:hypothetical protein